jgi:hydrogenase expression/formation protein HypC
MAAAALHRLGRTHEIAERFSGQQAAPAVAQMLAGNVHCPPTTSMGRMFDAAAGLLGIKAVMAYEGQAAMLMEGLAQRYGDVLPLDQGWKIRRAGSICCPCWRFWPMKGTPNAVRRCFTRRWPPRLGDWLRVWLRVKSGCRQRRLFPQPGAGARPAQPLECAGDATHRSAPGAAQRRRPERRSGVGRLAASGRLARGAAAMCLALPCRIVELRAGEQALIDVAGVGKEISLALVDDVAVGDYVIVHVGYALTRLDPEEAEKTLALVCRAG